MFLVLVLVLFLLFPFYYQILPPYLLRSSLLIALPLPLTSPPILNFSSLILSTLFPCLDIHIISFGFIPVLIDVCVFSDLIPPRFLLTFLFDFASLRQNLYIDYLS